MSKNLDKFVLVATFLVYAVGFILMNRGIGNIYYVAGAFSVLVLFKAITEKGFNPGNYLFYCIIIMILGIVLEALIKIVYARGLNTTMILIFAIIGVLAISYVSATQYTSVMTKGLKEMEEK